MNSALLALFIRSLREDARSRATYWARAGLGCFLLLVMVLFALPPVATNAAGRVFFSTVIVFQIIAVTLMGLSYFSSAIAEEKEEQTLGLLRMTGLSPLSILLGKSTSRLCGALLLLAAQFPFTIIAVTLGGISLGQIVAAYCTVGAFIFLLCNLALLGSVLARGTAGAAAFCVAVIGLLLCASPLLNGVEWLAVNGFNRHLSLNRVADAIWSATPIARLIEVLETGYRDGAVGWQVLTNIAFGVGCFLLAWAVFQRFCEREIEGIGAGTATRAVASVMVNSIGVRVRGPRMPRTWRNALVWKDFYFLWGGRVGFIIRVVGYGGALLYDAWKLVTTGGAQATFGFNAASYPLMPFIFSIDVSVMASRMFRTELRDQTFSSLALLPCGVREIVCQKVRACLLAAAPGAICSLAMQVLFLLFFKNLPATFMPFHGGWILTLAAGWLEKVLLLVLIAWLSLYMKRGALPTGWLIFYVGGWMAIAYCMVLLGPLFFTNMRTNPANLVWGITVGLPIVGIFVSWMLYRAGVRRLESLAGEE